MMCDFTLPEVFCTTSQSHHHFSLNALWLPALWINTHMDNDHVILLYPRRFAQRHKVITTFVWLLYDCLHCGLTLTWTMTMWFYSTQGVLHNVTSKQSPHVPCDQSPLTCIFDRLNAELCAKRRVTQWWKPLSQREMEGWGKLTLHTSV